MGEFFYFRFCDVVETNTILITLMSSSKFMFSLASGWSFVESEDWRKDVQCTMCLVRVWWGRWYVLPLSLVFVFSVLTVLFSLFLFRALVSPLFVSSNFTLLRTVQVEEKGGSCSSKISFFRSTQKYRPRDGFILALYTLGARLAQGIGDAGLAVSTDYTTPFNATLPYYSTLEYLGP